MAKQERGQVAARPRKLTIPHLMANLSPEKVATLSVRDLRRLLVRLSAALHAQQSRRPAWWPHILPWTQDRLIAAVKTAAPSAMRMVAKKCCRVLTQRSPPRALPAPVPVVTQPRVLDWINSQPPSRLRAQPVKLDTDSGSRKSGGVPYLDIYLCHLCNAEFSTKDTLQKHQVQCQGAALPSTPPVSEAPSPAPPACTPEDSHSVGVASVSTSSSSTSSVSQSQFIAALDLVPFYRAKKIRQARRRNTECETIDLEEPQTPVSPSTPRSHKILITQLSRDASSSSLGGTGSSGGLASRRSSCLRLSLDKRPDNLGNDKEEEQHAESDKESSESGAEDADEPKLRKKTLFSIAVSSALGQRIIKHMTSEVHVPVIPDAEEYCRTPIKDKYQDRLRIRQTIYPVTWKLTRKRQQQFYHLYKFSRADRLEFKEAMRTGLNRESRKLRDSLTKCSVVVKRLSSKTLLKWNAMTQLSVTRQLLKQAKAGSSQSSVFPEGPTFLLTDVDRVLGLKRKDIKPELARKLLASHCVSENANAEMQSQKLTVYRCLLTDLYSSVTSDDGQVSAASKKTNTPKTRQKYPALLSILSGSASEHDHPFQSKAADDASVDVQKPLKIDIPSPGTALLLPGEKSSSLDDSFSVRTVSSEEDVGKSMACCSLCTARNKCKCASKQSASAVLGGPSSSPALSSKVSTLSKASMSPPQLDPLSLTPKVSVSSHNSLSPPDLSPVSQVGETCPPSSSVAQRLPTRRSTLLLKTSSSFPKALPSSTHGLETGTFQCPLAPSLSQVLGSKRDDNATSKQAHNSPTPAKRSRSSPMLSSGLLQLVMVSDTQRPHTRSSSKQKVAGESSDSVVQQQPSVKGLECSYGSTENGAGQSSVPSSSGAEMKTSEELSSSSISSFSASSSVHTHDEKNANGQGVEMPYSSKEKNGHKLKSSSCTGSAVNIADSKKEGKEVKAGTETSEEAEKQMVRDKMQTRGSLRESLVDKSQRSEQREDAESKKLRKGKCFGAGDMAAEAVQEEALTKSTPIKDGGKALQKKAKEAVGKEGEASRERKHTAGDHGDRDTSGGTVLRNSDRKHTTEEINKQTSLYKNLKTVPERNKKELVGSRRKLRSRETGDGSGENKEMTVSEEATRTEQKTAVEVKTNDTETSQVVEKLKTRASEQVQNHQDENTTETRNSTEGKNKDLREDTEMLESGAIGSSERRTRASKDVLKAVSMKAINHRESRGKTKTVGRTEGKKLGTRKTDQHNDNVNKSGNSCQPSLEKNTGDRDITNSSLQSGDASKKEQADTTNQTGTALLRKISSRKSNVDTQGNVSVQTASKKKLGRIARETYASSINGENASVSSVNGENASASSINGGDASHTKASQQKMDISLGTVERRGVKRKLFSEETRVPENGLDSGIGNTSHANPFLISRAQTRFFSSRIKEQTRQAWKQKQKIPSVKGSKRRGLKSGNTFRMANVSIDAPLDAFGEKSKKAEKCALSLSLSNGPVTFTAVSTSPKSSFAGAQPSGSSPVDTSRMHLSPKQMLSVLESTKNPSKNKTRKEASSHGFPVRNTVRSSAVTKTDTVSGLGSSVNTISHRLPSTGTTDPSTPGGSANLQRISNKSYPGQGASTKTTTNQKTSVKSHTKISGERSWSKSLDSQPMETKVAGKRPSSNMRTGKRGRPRKKLCV